MFDLATYLARIALPAIPAADANGLFDLQRAHRLAIPFENLDILLGRLIEIDSASVFAKLVEAKRGGYCFEHNRLFLDALAACGFDARPLLARVWLGATSVPPLTHTFSLVTIDGQAWIADPGFGGSYAPPMPLVDGVEVDGPDGARFRLSQTLEHGWMLSRDGHPATTDGRGTGEGWQPQYSFTLDWAWDVDLALSNHWVSTAPSSRFCRHRVVSIVLPTGFASLTDGLYRRRAGDDEASVMITDPRIYRMRLSLMFGIALSVEQVAVLTALAAE